MNTYNVELSRTWYGGLQLISFDIPYQEALRLGNNVKPTAINDIGAIKLRQQLNLPPLTINNTSNITCGSFDYKTNEATFHGMKTMEEVTRWAEYKKVSLIITDNRNI